MKEKIGVPLLPAMLCLASVAFASETVELPPVADVSFRYSPTPPLRQNFVDRGAAHSIEASVYTGQGRGNCSLLRFDLSAIPADAKIKSARLLLTPTHTYPGNVYAANETLCVYQLAPENESWVEGTGVSSDESDNITVPSTNGAYLLMESFNSDADHSGTPWLNGKLISPMDFQGEAIGKLVLSETGLYRDVPADIELSPQTIQEWLGKPELAKAGLVLWMHTDEVFLEKSKFAIFHSREGSLPPQLVLEY